MLIPSWTSSTKKMFFIFIFDPACAKINFRWWNFFSMCNFFESLPTMKLKWNFFCEWNLFLFHQVLFFFSVAWKIGENPSIYFCLWYCTVNMKKKFRVKLFCIMTVNMDINENFIFLWDFDRVGDLFLSLEITIHKELSFGNLETNGSRIQTKAVSILKF